MQCYLLLNDDNITGNENENGPSEAVFEDDLTLPIETQNQIHRYVLGWNLITCTSAVEFYTCIFVLQN